MHDSRYSSAFVSMVHNLLKALIRDDDLINENSVEKFEDLFVLTAPGPTAPSIGKSKLITQK